MCVSNSVHHILESVMIFLVHTFLGEVEASGPLRPHLLLIYLPLRSACVCALVCVCVCVCVGVCVCVCVCVLACRDEWADVSACRWHLTAGLYLSGSV